MELNATIFVQIVIFLTLLLWLSRFLFAPIIRLFDEREKRIEGARSEAERLSGLAEEKSQTFEAEYKKARDKARHALSVLKNQMEKEQEQRFDAAKKKARERIDKASTELAAQEGQVKSKLMESSATIADEIVGALMRRSA